MQADERRFVSSLMLVFGPLFVMGGWLATFTLEGALFIYVGLGMLLSGLLLRTRMWTWVALGLGTALCVMMSVLTIMDYS